MVGLRLTGTTLQMLPDAHPQEAMEELAAAAPQLGNVEALVLRRCNLGVRDIEPLGRALRHLSNLRRLELGQNRLGSDGLSELGRYTVHLGKLRSLAVYRNGIGSIGLSLFMQTAEHLESLESFDLSENPLGDEGARALASSAEKLGLLRQLGLFDCGIGDNGAEALRLAVCRAAWTRSLQEIGFDRNPVMDYEALCRTNAADRWRDFEHDAYEGLNLLDLLEDLPRADDPAQNTATTPLRSDDAPVDPALVSKIRNLLQRSPGTNGAKRERDEKLRSLIALLDTCVEWPTADISRRRLLDSDLLREKRALQGLKGKVSLTTVFNHLSDLAELSGGAITTLGTKKQASRMAAGAKRRLGAIRPSLEVLIAEWRTP